MNTRTGKPKPQGELSRKNIMEYLEKKQVTVSHVSLREIAEGVGLSLTAVNNNIQVLIRQKKIRRNGVSSIEILRHEQKLTSNQKKNKGLMSQAKLLQIKEKSKGMFHMWKGYSLDPRSTHRVFDFSADFEELGKLLMEYEELQ